MVKANLTDLKPPDVHKKRWQMQHWIDQGCNPEELHDIEHHLWKQIQEQLSKKTLPESTISAFPGARLLAYGWEWATYLLPSQTEVIKVPSNILPVSDMLAFFENTKASYHLCKTYLPDFVLPTAFFQTPVPHLRQPFFPGSHFLTFDIQKLTPTQKELLQRFVKGLLVILDAHAWLPDIKLTPSHISRNVMISANELKLIDIAAYYDVFCLYPERAKKELEIKGNALKEVAQELSIY